MGAEVYANGNAISGKADDGKVIACFPDVCNSPPSPPAGPIPIPYPVSSFASDTTSGSKSVTVGGKEAMLKDQSYFSKCTGDEAATKTLGMGVVSHNISGKVYFAAWSMDVKIEGQNVDRHLDLTTSNHCSPNGNTTPIPETSRGALKKPRNPCKCKYDRDKCGTTPTTDQTKHVNQPDSKCWRRGCKTKTKGPFIADHQPSLNEKWYRGGCNDPDFCDKAKKTPGTPKNNKEYKELKPRCKACYEKCWTNIGKKRGKGKKDISEGSMESSKSASYRRQYREWRLKLKEC